MGTIPYFIHIYLQLGIVGVLWFIVFLVSLFVRHPDGCTKRDLNLQLFLAAFIGIILFYAESLREPIICILVYGLAACAWLPDEVKDPEPETIDLKNG